MNDRPLLLDASRLIWRRWVGRLPTGIDRVCLAYLEQYGARSQAVIQGKGLRRILNEAASDRLFELLVSPGPTFRADLTRLLGREWRGKRIETSLELADLILDEAEVAVVPGEAFGPSGYLRLSYALGDENLLEGVRRIQELFTS